MVKIGDRVRVVEQPSGFSINLVGKEGVVWERCPAGGPYWYLQGGDIPSHVLFHEKRLEVLGEGA